ncbi:serine/threonine protein kinase [Streptomyces sp. TRM66268-LWL]|uniref:non-specific serine/threonine protein kinase n=2 Tax=Streptomyces polyasparticus TaxID=2767826 RepID=A0ABR7SK80_9ACTN|nr:serine/threonine protein kinase [Streptomyces polyasparticus]
MGEVWRGWDRMLERPVALKLLPRPDDAESLIRLRSEARAAARLNHPGVVAVYDLEDRGEQPCLVMEYVSGQSLAQLLTSRGPQRPSRSADLAAQTAAGLAAAHRQGVVHRDVKPGNLLLSSDGPVKVCDFGIARYTDATTAVTRTGHLIGTTGYLAPERARGESATPASDVYSLGCVLYELLTGRPPFTADTSLAVLHQHVATAPLPPRRHRPEIPEALDAYVQRMLSKDPAQRPTAEQAARWFTSTAWQNTHSQAPVSSRTEPTPTPATPPHSNRRSRRALVAAAAVTAVSLALAAGLPLALSGDQNGPRTSPPRSPTSNVTVTVTATAPPRAQKDEGTQRETQEAQEKERKGREEEGKHKDEDGKHSKEREGNKQGKSGKKGA